MSRSIASQEVSDAIAVVTEMKSFVTILSMYKKIKLSKSGAVLSQRDIMSLSGIVDLSCVPAKDHAKTLLVEINKRANTIKSVDF